MEHGGASPTSQLSCLAVAWALLHLGATVIDACLRRACRTCPAVTHRKYTLRASDYACVACNTVVETVFVLWVWRWCDGLPRLSWHAPIAAAALFVGDDLLYTPFHVALHRPRLYAWIHARHHRIAEPSEQYLHAVLEHPLEMACALALHGAVLCCLRPILDWASVWAHLGVKGVLATLNHSGRAVRVPRLYDAGAHQLHHRKRNVNYAQTHFFVDRLLGTYCAAD